AECLLLKLGAIDEKGTVTAIGAKMLRFPLHPRQSRMLVEAEARGVGEQARVVAALIGERDIVASELFKNERERKAAHEGPSDLLERVDLFEGAAGANFAASRLREMNLDVGAVMAVNRVRRQLAGTRGAKKQGDEALLISILAGYPDRVAKRRSLKSDNRE